MIFSSIFGNRVKKPIWEYKTDGVLWRITFSSNGFIVGEDRDVDKKVVTYFCLDSKNGNVLWRDLTFCDPFWSAVKGIIANKLFIHGFRKPDMPEQHKISVVDLKSGKELWFRNDISVLSANQEFICAFRDFFEKRVYYLIDINNGELVQEFNQLPETYLAEKDFTGRTNFIYPQPAEINIDLKNKLSKFIPFDKIKGSIEMTKWNNFIFFSFHTQQIKTIEGSLNFLHQFSIIDELKNKLIFKTILNKETPNIVPDSFFIDGNNLYILKEKSTISVFDISKL
ncbi:MAG: DUF4905 domain-containing protein [Bacteroidetes bacterium]|nr:DUF4905 domain-containing protein [Bacteroidota bacterium]